MSLLTRMRYAFLVFAAIISVALIRGICTYGQTVLMNFIGLRIVTDLRNELYNHIQRQSLAFFYKNPTGTLMSRITSDVSLVQTAVSEAVTSILKDSVTLVGLIFVVFYRDWKLAIIAMVVFPLTVLPIVKFGQKMRKVASSTQVTLAGLRICCRRPLPAPELSRPSAWKPTRGNGLRRRMRNFTNFS